MYSVSLVHTPYKHDEYRRQSIPTTNQNINKVYIMTNPILTAFNTGKPIRLKAMTVKEFAQLLESIKGSK